MIPEESAAAGILPRDLFRTRPRTPGRTFASFPFTLAPPRLRKHARDCCSSEKNRVAPIVSFGFLVVGVLLSSSPSTSTYRYSISKYAARSAMTQSRLRHLQLESGYEFLRRIDHCGLSPRLAGNYASPVNAESKFLPVGNGVFHLVSINHAS